MDDVKINTSKTLTLTLPSDADSNIVNVTLTHEFGDVVQSNIAASRISTGVYSITYGQQASGKYVLNSDGKYKANFVYSVANTSYSQSQYINVYTPYITWSEFVDNHPELASFESKFDYFEKRVRNIINNFCGQSFESYDSKSITVDGNGHFVLHLPFPIVALRKVTMNFGRSDIEVIHDITDASLDNLEKVAQPFNFESSYYIRFRSTVSENSSAKILSKSFHSDSTYKVEGDFGWKYVPLNVKQAADLLILDFINDDSEYRRHGITTVDMDTLRFTFGGSMYETTGNIEADNLLSDYILFIMDYVI